MMEKWLVVLLGPTGVGKTELCLEMAEDLRCPILNCDSRQIFRGIETGTAAPTPQQLARVKHYFVGTHDIHDYYSAAQYEADVLKLSEELYRKKDVLLLSGGSMLYIDAVCNGIDDIPTVDELTRQTLKERLDKEGLEALAEELKLLDPDYYDLVDRKNTRRVIHALEICYMTGKTYSSFRKREERQRPFRILKIGLQRPREELFARINQRVETMMQNGLLEEARKWYLHREANALNTVGFKEMFAYLDGTFTLTEAKERLKKNTRVYAKKQLTWFAKDRDIHWFHPDQKEEIRTFVHQTIGWDS